MNRIHKALIFCTDDDNIFYGDWECVDITMVMIRLGGDNWICC